MKILFCKISYMKYYKGTTIDDKAINGGSFVKENGYGHERFNFSPVEFSKDAQYHCLGFVETKTTSKDKRNQLKIENIQGCESMKKEDSVNGVLVVWCATNDRNETVVVGWYKNATVYREYQVCQFGNEEIFQDYNVIAHKNDCVLLPENSRRRFHWSAPVAKKRGFGFGQAMVWYARDEKANNFIKELVQHIEEYNEENWIDKDPNEG